MSFFADIEYGYMPKYTVIISVPDSIGTQLKNKYSASQVSIDAFCIRVKSALNKKFGLQIFWLTLEQFNFKIYEYPLPKEEEKEKKIAEQMKLF